MMPVGVSNCDWPIESFCVDIDSFPPLKPPVNTNWLMNSAHAHSTALCVTFTTSSSSHTQWNGYAALDLWPLSEKSGVFFFVSFLTPDVVSEWASECRGRWVRAFAPLPGSLASRRRRRRSWRCSASGCGLMWPFPTRHCLIGWSDWTGTLRLGLTREEKRNYSAVPSKCSHYFQWSVTCNFILLL